MEGKYTITLSDGTQISNLDLNGNNFVSKTKVKESDFEGKLQVITVTNGEEETVMHNCELVQIVKTGNEYWFVINEMSEEKLTLLQMQANIDFIAALSDIEL